MMVTGSRHFLIEIFNAVLKQYLEWATISSGLLAHVIRSLGPIFSVRVQKLAQVKTNNISLYPGLF